MACYSLGGIITLEEGHNDIANTPNDLDCWNPWDSKVSLLVSCVLHFHDLLTSHKMFPRHRDGMLQVKIPGTKKTELKGMHTVNKAYTRDL